MQSDFLSLFGSPNECLRLIIIYYMFKYSFGIKTTLLELLWSQKKALETLYFGKPSYKDIDFARSDFLRIVGAPNESLILILIYYMFKYSVGI